MLAVGRQARRRRGDRLLDEPRDREGARCVVERGADGDVAVAGLGRGRAHAERHDVAGARGLRGGGEVRVQHVGVGDHVIGGEQPQHGVGIVLGDQDRGGGDGGGGVAANRLQQDARGDDAGGAELLGDQETVLLVAHDDRRGEAVAAGAERGFLEQGVLGDQRPELLGEALARDRPEAGAGAAGEDDRNDGGGVHAGGVCLIGGGGDRVKAVLTVHGVLPPGAWLGGGGVKGVEPRMHTDERGYRCGAARQRPKIRLDAPRDMGFFRRARV